MAKNEVTLRISQLLKNFGGLSAVDRVEFSLQHGVLTALIGPNGAGKTTLFNLIGGLLKPTSGHVFFNDKDITGLSPDKISHMGIARTLQITSIFQGLTTFENIWVAAQSRKRFFNPFIQSTKLRDVEATVRDLLERFWLSNKAETLASDLSHGDQRLLEIAIALATKPSLVLLDEPTSGLSEVETDSVKMAIKDLIQELDILLVEHNMDVVMGIADQVIVLDNGNIIASGTPDQISKNELVQKVYFGG